MSWHFNVSYWIDLMNLQPCALGFFFRGHWCMTYLGILRPREKLFKKIQVEPFPALEASIFERPFTIPGTPRPTIYKWMEVRWFPTIFVCKDLVHHPVETSIYKWLFGVPGVGYCSIPLAVKNWKMGIFEKLENGDILHGRKQTIIWKTNPSFDWVEIVGGNSSQNGFESFPNFRGKKNPKKYVSWATTLVIHTDHSQSPGPPLPNDLRAPDVEMTSKGRVALRKFNSSKSPMKIGCWLAGLPSFPSISMITFQGCLLWNFRVGVLDVVFPFFSNETDCCTHLQRPDCWGSRPLRWMEMAWCSSWGWRQSDHIPCCKHRQRKKGRKRQLHIFRHKKGRYFITTSLNF